MTATWIYFRYNGKIKFRIIKYFHEYFSSERLLSVERGVLIRATHEHVCYRYTHDSDALDLHIW